MLKSRIRRLERKENPTGACSSEEMYRHVIIVEKGQDPDELCRRRRASGVKGRIYIYPAPDYEPIAPEMRRMPGDPGTSLI